MQTAAQLCMCRMHCLPAYILQTKLHSYKPQSLHSAE